MENDNDDETLIDDYDHTTPDIFYVPTSIPGKGCDLNIFESSISDHCNCNSTTNQPNCTDPATCPCLQSSQGSNYHDKLLIDNKLLETSGSSSVIECGSRCFCSSNCSNRLVQFGPNPDLEIINAAAKGYGVVCKSNLQKGQFVCEYAGEIISEQEASQRRKNDNSNYIFVLNEFVSGDDTDNVIRTVIDATCIANIGRYINHSCNPNCIVVPVRIDSLVPRLAIFAKRLIPAMQEITYSYNSSVHDPNAVASKLCLCGETNCCKFLPGNF